MITYQRNKTIEKEKQIIANSSQTLQAHLSIVTEVIEPEGDLTSAV